MTVSIGFGSNERGVSDVVGYVLIFSLITATVGVVTVTGYGTLDDRQQIERINNVERAFDVFAANMENVYRDGAPSRATELRLAGGTLGHGDRVSITIADADDPTVNVTAVPRPLVYSDGNTDIVYVGGAILRTEDESSVMLREPPFRFDSSGASVPLVLTFRTSGPRTVSTEGTVRVTSTARSVDTNVSEAFAGADTYTVSIESPRSDAWYRYFDSHVGDGIVGVTHDEAAGTVEAELEADTVAVSRIPIRLRFSA